MISEIQAVYRRKIECLIGVFCLTLLFGCQPGAIENAEDLEKAYLRGLRLIESFDLNQAANVLEPAYLFVKDSDPLYLQISYAYALALWQSTPVNNNNIHKAAEIFQRISENNFSNDLQWQAKINLARIYEYFYPSEHTDYLENARELYAEIYAEAKPDYIRETALLYYSNSYIKQFYRPDAVMKGINLLREHLGLINDGPLASVLWQTLGDAYIFNFNDYYRALEAYDNANLLGFANDSLAHVYYWLMAGWAIQAGQVSRAVELYTVIVTDYPRSVLGTLARDSIIKINQQFPDRHYPVPALHTSPY
jgi:tetratricopeptide (TPR) repeat protein